MDSYVEALYGDIVLKFKRLLVEEEDNEISVSGPQNFIYAFYDSDIDIITVEVPAPPATGYDILLYSDVIILMQYVVSYPNPDVEYGTQGTMAVTLTAGGTSEFVTLDGFRFS